MSNDLQHIEGKNDRRNLILLLNKEEKTLDEQSVIAMLSTVYPDFLYYHVQELMDDLRERKFVKIINMCTDVSVEAKDDNEKWVTTEDGIRALKVDFFPSEYKKKNIERNRQTLKDRETDLNIKALKNSTSAKRISIIAIIISIISLLSELGLLQRWLPNLF